ncbi:hypothetical protein Nmel_005727 [Mimus melanotis]
MDVGLYSCLTTDFSNCKKVLGLLVVKRGLCWRRRTLCGSGNLILESCKKNVSMLIEISDEQKILWNKQPSCIQ